MKFQQIKNDVDTYLKQYFEEKGTFNKTLYDSMSYSLNIGGKRIRPILMMLTYEMIKNEKGSKILPFAGAIEMIHTYSLIHDDLPCMDDDDLRRGKPTNHKVYGEAIAVLAGDGLLNEAFNVMISYALKEGKNALKAVKIVGESAGCEGMIGGQTLDILNENKKSTLEELEYIHSKKTAELIKASILAGAVLADAPEEDITTLKSFGEKLGLAFQIKDDILDVEGDAQVLGKNTHSDLDNNKFTYISLLGLDKCKEKCWELTEECIKELTSLKYDTESLLLITKYLLERNY
ncbi:polyprenyl synthetase family protein [Clostridium polynesiense]|uniref:polyprenyl synthetase family protein n=1 Tax=Clostridium polynesiense TaxID=1325933 RepID=UPI003BF99BEE